MKTHRSGGFTYIGVLAFVAITGLLSAKAMVVISTSQRSDDEKELIFVGQQFQTAIASYYNAAPSGLPSYPSKLEDLVLDPRFAEARRHLRRVYRDPVTRRQEWGLVMDGSGGIRGVHSLSEQAAVKKGGFPVDLEHFSEVSYHHEWIFEFYPLLSPGVHAVTPDIPAPESNQLPGGFGQDRLEPQSQLPTSRFSPVPPGALSAPYE